MISLADNAGRILYKQFTMNALNPLQITTTAMPNAHVGDAYSEQIRTSGGIAPFTYSHTGLLPAGLSLHPTTGIVYGTPSSASYVNLTLTVSDSSYPTPQTITQALGVRTTSQMTITNNSVLPTARVNTLINPVTLAVAGGTSPFSWSIINGAFPPGINFNTSTGTISGTPTTAGDYIVTLRLADSAGNTTGTVSNPDKQFFMHVSAPLVITTTTVPVGGVGIPYATNLAASGGQLNYSWSVAPGTLPAGLSLNPNGTISGIPTAKISGSVTFTVTDSDISPQTAQKAITFTVKDTLTIIENSLPNARSGQAYTSDVHAMLGTPPYTWRVSAGVKPDGLNLVQNAGIATLQGTPSTSGTYSYTIEVTDSSNPQQVVTQQYTTITYEPFSITKASLKNAERTINYYDVITVNGGVSPYTYTLATGTLPQGLSLNPATGVVSGAPVAVTSQSSTFTVRVTDSGNPAYFVDKEFSIFVTDPVPVVGACGGNNGKVLAVAPTTGLCTSGTPSASGTWSWNCTGMYGGAPASCSATFGYPVSVTVTGTGYGTVTSDAVAVGVPSDISCSKGTCSAGYPNNSSVTLSAVPSATSTFGGWTGACTATPCVVTMNVAKAVTATFTDADRARVVGGKGFSSLAAAYLEAAKSASATIKTLDTTLNENLTMDKPVAIMLTGGWNATFGSKSGMPTLLNGGLMIGSGSLTVDELTIK